eukprot:917066-Pelagomonas_calceolata.AAC.11
MAPVTQKCHKNCSRKISAYSFSVTPAPSPACAAAMETWWIVNIFDQRLLVAKEEEECSGSRAIPSFRMP